MSNIAQLRADAQKIWWSGVAAVQPDRLIPRWLRVESPWLCCGQKSCEGFISANTTTDGLRLPLAEIGRIAVVGGGKAAGAMALAVERILAPHLRKKNRLFGWVNVPADVATAFQGAWRHIHLHPARPVAMNEPTPEGVAGTKEIIRIVGSLGPADLCLCLLSGGGSALLPAPAEGLTLNDKLAVTQFLSAAGANIEELNTVRKHLSLLKGGGLRQACRAGRLVALIISDVLGDRLDLIASGPTAADPSTPQDALDVLARFRAQGKIPQQVFDFLHAAAKRPKKPVPENLEVWNFIIANNATAVQAAAAEAQRLGYRVTTESAAYSESAAEEVGWRLADKALKMAAAGGRRCHISGGEPIVRLVEPEHRGLGGRNQQLVLAALERLAEHPPATQAVVLLSAGTDGEDGPTDAAGAFCDAQVIADARNRRLIPADYLARNNAYHFFEPLGALLRTGQTHTNVCDLRVVLTESNPTD